MAEGSAQSPPKQSAVGLSSTGVFVIALAIQFLGYIPTHYFAAHVGLFTDGRTVLGTFQLFLLIASSVNMIADLRIGSAYTFYIARGESPTVGTGTYFLLRLVMVAAAGALLWIAGPSIGYAPSQFAYLFALWMLLPVLWSVSTVYAQQQAALGRSVHGQVPQLVESVARTAALTGIALWTLGLSDGTFSQIVAPITYAYLFGAGVSAVYSFPAVWRATRRYRTDVTRRYVRYAWPLMGSLILLYLASTLPQFFVVGHYKEAVFNVFLSANGLRILLLAIPGAVAVPLFPHLSGLHKRQDYELIRQRTWAALRYTAIATVPLIAAMVVYRAPLLNILYAGPYANEGGIALAVLAVSGLPAVLAQIIGTALSSVGLQRLELYLTSLQVAVLVLVMTLLMPPFGWFALSGSTAAAVAVLVSSAAALGLNSYFMHSLLGVRIQLRSTGTIVVAAAASFFVVGRFNAYISISRYYVLFAAVLLGFVVYAFALAAIGELSKSDVHLIVGALGLPRSWGVALARLCWRVESWPVNPMPAGGAAGLKPLDPAYEVPEGPGSQPPGGR